MGIFSSKISYLGIDLGTSSIKVVEMANLKGRPRLVTYGFSEKKLLDFNNCNDLIGNADEAAAVLSDVCKKSRVTTKRVIAALPNFSVFTSILSLPALSKKELESAIGWEAKKIIPIPLEEIILDWKIIADADDEVQAPDKSTTLNDGANAVGVGEASVDPSQQANAMKKIFSKPKKNIKILLTGASKKLVRKYIDIFTKAGLTLLSLETESFALIRSLIGNDKSTISIIDIGATSSSIIIVEKGIPVLSRSIEVGGFMITRAISNSLNVNLDRAEQFKQDMSMDRETANNSLPQTVDKSFSVILNEIKYTINLFSEQNGRRVEKIILTGGSALLGNLSGYLAKTLNINTYVGDPWARVVYPTELKPILDRLGSRFAVAVGLSVRDIE